MRPFLFVALLLALPVVAAADCPPAHFTSTSIPAHDFYRSVADTALLGSPESVTVRFDLIAGEAFLRRRSGLGGGGSTLNLVDDYTISGFPDGTPVSLSAKLAAYGNAQAGYFAHLRIVSHVRVVTSLPNVFSISVMNTGPRGSGR